MMNDDAPGLTRRRLFTAATFGVLASACGKPTTSSRAVARVVVVGGGFAGATAARTLKRLKSGLDVTLVERSAVFTACPFSNLVIAGMRDLAQQRFGYAALEAEGIRLAMTDATDVDGANRIVTLRDGSHLEYDRLVLAPGIALRWNALSGYDQAAAELMPHAWQAGPQTLLLRRQLEAMADGGLVIIAAPENPYRCPPGPYERASLVAHYLKTYKPRAKLIVLDAKDAFSKQKLFQHAWAEHYGDLIEWRGLADGGTVRAVDARSGTVETDFETFKPAVANIIPPQRAGTIAERAGVTDASLWCPVEPIAFESTQQPGIHVLGDAAIANAMPKSAFAANAQAKVCAMQIVRLLDGQEPIATTLANTCYSLVAPEYGISVAGVYRAGVYRPGANLLEPVAGAGGVSPSDADAAFRALEAGYARDWFRTITAETFG